MLINILKWNKSFTLRWEITNKILKHEYPLHYSCVVQLYLVRHKNVSRQHDLYRSITSIALQLYFISHNNTFIPNFFSQPMKQWFSEDVRDQQQVYIHKINAFRFIFDLFFLCLQVFSLVLDPFLLGSLPLLLHFPPQILRI